MTFLNVVEIESALNGLAATYPNISQLITLPNFTAEGRQSHALLIGTRKGCPAAGVLIISGAHAREWGGPDICINFATDLLEAYSGGTGLVYGGTSYTVAQIKSIIERVDVIVFPDINPDGRHYSQNTFAMWRKNRNTASSGGQASKIGVDPNRNYDFLWDFNTTFDPAAQAGIHPTISSTERRPSLRPKRKTFAGYSNSIPTSVGSWISTRTEETFCMRGVTTRTRRATRTRTSQTPPGTESEDSRVMLMVNISAPAIWRPQRLREMP